MIGVHVVVAGALLAAALYAHYRLPFHVRPRGQVALVRAVLALVGVGAGYVAAAHAPDAAPAAVAFVQGFGLVHVPAAFILFLKRAQGRA